MGELNLLPVWEGQKDNADDQLLAPHCPPKESPPSPTKSTKAPQRHERIGRSFHSHHRPPRCCKGVGPSAVTAERVTSTAAPRRAPGGHSQWTPSNSRENLIGGQGDEALHEHRESQPV